MYKKLLSETVIYGIGAILPRVIIFLLNPFYINQIDVDEFAQFTNLYAVISFVNIILTFGFETAFFRFGAEKGLKEKTLNTAFLFLFSTASLFLILTLSFNQPISDLLGYSNNTEYIKWFAWIAFFDTLCVIPFAWLRFNNKPIKYAAIRVTQSLLQTIFVLSLFLWIPIELSMSFGMEKKVSFPFFSNLAGSLLGVVLLLPIILKVRFKPDFQLLKRMVFYSFPVMIAGLAFVVNENFDKLIQIHIIPDADAGAYGGSYKLAVLMTLFVTAFRMGVEPFFFKQMNQKNAKKIYAQVTEFFIIASSIVALGIITNLSWLKKLFITDKAYWIAIDIIPIIVIANLFFGIYFNLSTWYKVTDRTHFGTYISWLGALITIVLNLWLLPKYGFMVSAWTTLIAYFLMMISSYLLGQKYYPIPYKINKIILYLTLVVFFSYISYVIFGGNFWIGNLLLIVYVSLLFYLEKDTIKSKFIKNES